MAKAKSKSTFMVADGTGGMAQVHDWRLESGYWPIRFEVPDDQAETWLEHLSAECGRRGWRYWGSTQLDAAENSGSLTISSGGPGQPQLALAWERNPQGPIKIRARSVGTPEFPSDQANDFFQVINERSAARFMEQFHRAGHLSYEGLAWRGELWLEDWLRLGPPSKQDETALIGPRIVLVDASINGIDEIYAAFKFKLVLDELATFLAVIMGTQINSPTFIDRAWTYDANSPGRVECEIRWLGYFEKERPDVMPAKGVFHPVPLEPVSRPEYSRRGIDGTQLELHLPMDILDLWRGFRELSPTQRRQFLQAASMWQLALSLKQDYQTARFAWMVATCECLKPPDPKFDKHNIYHVIDALLGKSIADQLQQPWFRPQAVRNAHFHRGDFRGSEFIRHSLMSSFQDPTFDQACRELYQITQAAIIEWIRRRGVFSMPPIKHQGRKKR